jgi:hypothetical protein
VAKYLNMELESGMSIASFVEESTNEKVYCCSEKTEESSECFNFDNIVLDYKK